ncbi:MAG: nuclear transport factor 2 family protein [Halioglobus sp.]|nr:nuclear transport factor 2 family protein [Halioglobus sp.]
MNSQYAIDRIQLQDVLLNYAAAVDERNRENYRACFSENVEVVGFGSQIYHGRDSWVDYVWRTLEKYSATQHMLGPQLATIHGVTAYTRTNVQALHFIANSSEKFTLWGTYKNSLQRHGDNWLIHRHELIVNGKSSS